MYIKLTVSWIQNEEFELHIIITHVRIVFTHESGANERRKRFRTICLFTHAASNTLTDGYSIVCTYQIWVKNADIRTISTNFPRKFDYQEFVCPGEKVPGSLCGLHLHRTSGLPRMCDIDFHLIFILRSYLVKEIRLCCQSAVLPAPNGCLTKLTHRAVSAILFAGQHYPLQKTVQTKATW